MIIKFLQMLTKQYRSGDFDSDHPVCLWLIEKHGLDPIQGNWLTFLTMAFYNEVSAWIAFNQSDPFVVPKDCRLPIDKNRRNLYGPGIVRHLHDLCEAFNRVDGPPYWPCHEFTDQPEDNWLQLKQALRSVWGNGRFAVYNTADMLHKVNGLNVAVTDFENSSSSGPADAIHRISGCDRSSVKELDIAGESIFERAIRTGLRPNYTISDRGTVESVLCNFSGMCRGKYYPGRNIDRQQGRILALTEAKPNLAPMLDTFWEARQSQFSRAHLGEFNGWVGVDKPRLKVYKQTGVMLCPEEQRT